MTARLACALSDVPECGSVRVDLPGDRGLVEVAVVRDADGNLHAISDLCSHESIALSEGEVEGTTIECWLHGGTFDLATGQAVKLPATEPVPVYPLTVEGERVFVDVDAPKEH